MLVKVIQQLFTSNFMLEIRATTKSYYRSHSKSTYAKGEGLSKKAHENVQGGGALERTYSHVIFKR